MDNDDDHVHRPDYGQDQGDGRGRGRMRGRGRWGHGRGFRGAGGWGRGGGRNEDEHNLDHGRFGGRGRGEHRGRGEGHWGRGADRAEEEGRGHNDGDGARGGRGQGFRGRGGRGGGHYLDYRQLQELRSKDPSTIVMTLGQESGLGSLLKRHNLSSHMMYAIVGALAQACLCKSAQTNLIELLLTVQRSKFYDHVPDVLNDIRNRPNENPREKRQFIKDLISVMKELATRLPHSYIHVLGVKSFLEMILPELELKSDIVDEEMLQHLKQLQDMQTPTVDRTTKEEGGDEKKEYTDGTPPSDFRDMSIFPNVEDIHPEEKPFLRKNIDVGRYNDLHHYLDVQFRLLREDFVYPLRNGIAEYQAANVPGEKGQRLKDIRVYHDVQIVRTVCSDGGLLHRIMFDMSKLRKIRWENSKRLIYGSLVCLSHDNFETLLFATVSDRDPKKLQDGILDVLLENDEDLDDILSLDTRFVMVETSAYFEAYRHVLRGLQMLRDGDLPFEEYIVECESEVKSPQYLRGLRTVKYDLRPLVDEKTVLREDTALRLQKREVSYDFSRESQIANNIEILNHLDWPSAIQLHLDPSQYKALKTALTKEFVIMQGPPGTGKTYVGLKIVKALLHNTKTWNANNRSPMLIVCYTNHALDQFLEGIISFYRGSIIRVGGRIKSEQLEDYSLKAQRQRARKLHGSRDMRNTGRMRWEIRNSMMTLKLEIEKIGQQIEAAEREILHEDVLRPFMGESYDDMVMAMNMMLMQMQEANGHVPPPTPVMVEWLGIGAFGEMVNPAEQPQPGEDIENEDEDGGLIDVQEEADLLQEQRQMHDMDDGDMEESELDKLQRMIEHLQYERGGYVAFDVTNLDRNPKEQEDAMQFQLQPEARRRLKRRILKRLRSTQRMTSAEANRVRDPWALQMNDRWKLYRFWVHCLCERLQRDISTKEARYKAVVTQYKESQMIEDKQIMETATVIGMTTTGAARYQQVLSEIGPKVIVVEEAAEVLEGHIITTLSKKCEHLILIGDHKQLKPNPTVYKLAKQFKLDLSLFERMINNGMHCDTLALQHRMRPEIARLMKPIYPKLENHSSVLNYEKIKGISDNMFFINHGYQEEHDIERVSHANEFEARYVVALCEYLMKQGYERSQITILTTYSGQLLKLKKMMPKQIFQGVRLTVVDNYQGEENDIILLSLVRSNAEGSVGFLKIENRVCVALSRAKKGLYVIGNFDLLAQESQLWREIKKDLQINNQIGTTLNLYCQNHPRDTGIAAKKPEDFGKAPEGGCMKQCTFRLECGHVCSRLCHPYDPNHEEYKCNKPCPKSICQNNHPCPRLCYQQCEKCEVPVEKVIPRCGHKQLVPCCMNPRKYECQAKCDKVLKCGHPCGNPCGIEHQCKQMVKKTWRCGHTSDVECMRKDSAVCKAKCSTMLECGHTCAGNCHDCHEGRLHVSCRKNCKRILVCGHECKDMCSNCPPCRNVCENRCPHSKCYKICGEICVPCNEPCEWKCLHHACTKKCREPCNRPPCDEPCLNVLRCGHQCIGLCGEPCPRLCRVCNHDEVTSILFGTEDEPDARFVELEDCGHIVEVSAMDRLMQMDPENDAIQLKTCPHCKTQIRRNTRYGSLIKKMLKDIDTVKKRYIGDDRIRVLKAKLEAEANREVDPQERNEKLDMLKKGYVNTEVGLNAIENQFRFLKRASKLFDSYEKLAEDCKEAVLRPVLRDAISSMKELEQFRKWLMGTRSSLSDQDVSDAQDEVDRNKAIIRLLKVERIIAIRNPEARGFEKELQALQGTLKYGKRFTKQRQERVKNIFEILKKHVPESGLGISEEERVEIVKAMALTKGHWFKCPNGHVYAIGECGGATMVSKCPECNATIGGTGHRLRGDNALAPEMDGAAFAAWSEQANLGNYNLDML
ncbi:LOW QUALITY PROTEIN: NFX1-type zinc finger-containing protein 1-like [Haliotis rubra]|uniref:LOW QUALITY PROTEIN: NFX1-type zinc finger-containing protein 1-like n=1 Tax=Haliotis rubra TaxID=36100 RepID=UPI001EE581AF|nr:LOW QUALITY PROTEIN: NFX1-type zinc finger-containing protein 1-like [Haliotis rubra]